MRELWAPAHTPCCCIRGVQSYYAGLRLRHLALQKLRDSNVTLPEHPQETGHIVVLWRPDRGFVVNWKEMYLGLTRAFPQEQVSTASRRFEKVSQGKGCKGARMMRNGRAKHAVNLLKSGGKRKLMGRVLVCRWEIQVCSRACVKACVRVTSRVCVGGCV